MSFSPHDLLPAPEPRTYEPNDTFFYENVAKHLVKDTVRIMANGLHIDLDRVLDLENTLDAQLEQVQTELDNNPSIVAFQEEQCKKQREAYIEEKKSKLKTAAEFIKPFKYNDMTHRSYVMYLWAQNAGEVQPKELLPTGIPKWDAKLCKNFTSPFVVSLLAGQLDESNGIVKAAMDMLAQHKADLYNDKYMKLIDDPKVECPSFNPGSSQQKQMLFEFLGVTAEKTSKTTGLPSFDRAEVERINKESSDPDIVHITQCFIDHSFAAIVRNNFIEAFYKYTIQDRLYGTYRLLGAKSGRYTSQNP